MTEGKRVAQKIERSLRARKGIGDEWDAVDDEIQEEITADIASIVDDALDKARRDGANEEFLAQNDGI